MMRKETLQEKIVRAFTSSMGEADVAKEIAFHLTDCESDFREIYELFSNPEKFSDSDVRRHVISFLAHAPNHLAAAKKLVGLGPIEDIFGANVFTEDE